MLWDVLNTDPSASDFKDIAETLFSQERQKREEVVEAERERISKVLDKLHDWADRDTPKAQGIRSAVYMLREALTQPNNSK